MKDFSNVVCGFLQSDMSLSSIAPIMLYYAWPFFHYESFYLSKYRHPKSSSVDKNRIGWNSFEIGMQLCQTHLISQFLLKKIVMTNEFLKEESQDVCFGNGNSSLKRHQIKSINIFIIKNRTAILSIFSSIFFFLFCNQFLKIKLIKCWLFPKWNPYFKKIFKIRFTRSPKYSFS